MLGCGIVLFDGRVILCWKQRVVIMSGLHGGGQGNGILPD